MSYIKFIFTGDYRNMTGEGIPFRKLGFDSLGALLQSLPETLIVRKLPTGGMMVALAGSGHQRYNNNQGQVGSLVLCLAVPTSNRIMSCFRTQET